MESYCACDGDPRVAPGAINRLTSAADARIDGPVAHPGKPELTEIAK